MSAVPPGEGASVSVSAGPVTAADLFEAMDRMYKQGGKPCHHVFHPRAYPIASWGSHQYAVCAQCFALVDVCVEV